MRYYNIFPISLVKIDSEGIRRKAKTNNLTDLCWRLPPEGWIKINVDVSRRQESKSTTIGFVMRDNNANIIMARDKKIENYCILMAECWVVREAIIAIQKNIHRLIIRVTQVVVDAINVKILVLKDIANLVEDIRR